MFTNWLTTPASIASVLSSGGVVGAAAAVHPPDVILEIATSPTSGGGVRFVAHAALLSMHSGYLRSALRIDENGIHNSEMTIFLTNVTPEQFAPLLSYMYTGFLDLTIENIFGILLATHVLHMPRALEICRAFLARTQSGGYLGGSVFLPECNKTIEKLPSPVGRIGSVKVIRPIASKPQISNLGFIVPPTPHVCLPMTGTPFRSFSHNQQQQKQQQTDEVNNFTSPASEDAQIVSKKRTKIPSPRDSPILLKKIPRPLQGSRDNTSITKKSIKIKRSSATGSVLVTAEKPKRFTELQSLHIKKDNLLAATITTSATVPAIKTITENDNNSKIIIDIASCDGPVRFRRVLNEAYGRQPQNSASPEIQNQQERTHQSVSHSFHQQMAKNIIQQRQSHSDESENSEDYKQAGQSTNEVYNCVYCKHTFKSQYCYQKHAKRHLNPLSIDSSSCEILSEQQQTINDEKLEKIAVESTVQQETNPTSVTNANSSKREVRPLDMNVQYYPCKTCGSKFPSYYFVHKHRKMCHANEENTVAVNSESEL